MVEHDLRVVAVPTADPVGRGRRAGAVYSLKQAFFYQSEWWIDREPLVSRGALDYAASNWGARADAIWGLRRTQVAAIDGRPIRAVPLIYEHVYTGTMFLDALREMFLRCGDRLDPDEVAAHLDRNFQTAWVTREENGRLPVSRRGRSTTPGGPFIAAG